MMKLNNTLIKVKEMLPTIKRAKKSGIKPSHYRREGPGELYFDINHWRCEGLKGDHSCGTVCCIGGLCEVVLGRRLSPAERGYADALFYPPGMFLRKLDVSNEQAIRAIDNFLKDGNPRWETIL